MPTASERIRTARTAAALRERTDSARKQAESSAYPLVWVREAEALEEMAERHEQKAFGRGLLHA